MRRILAFLFIPLFVASIGFVGCGDDDDPIGNVNQRFAFKAGDKYTYDYYDRDAQNMRDESTKKVVTWTVLETGISGFNGRSNVTSVEEVRYEADGTTETGRDTIHFQIDADGQIHIYDYFGTILNRFSGDLDLAAYLTGLNKVWLQLGSTNDANARVLVDEPTLINQTLTDVDVEGIVFDAQISLGYRSEHLGRDSLEVLLGKFDAFSTDNIIRVSITNKDPLNIGVGTLPPGTTIVGDSVMTHFDVDIVNGILRQTLDSKTVSVAGFFSTDVAGFEMELKSVVLASAE